MLGSAARSYYLAREGGDCYRVLSRVFLLSGEATQGCVGRSYCEVDVSYTYSTVRTLDSLVMLGYLVTFPRGLAGRVTGTDAESVVVRLLQRGGKVSQDVPICCYQKAT